MRKLWNIAAAAFLFSGQLTFLYPGPAWGGELGANKFDLMLQYLPQSDSITGVSRNAQSIRRAMAKKAIADAHDAGFGFLRVSVAGFRPAAFEDQLDDLAFWERNPDAFWSATDEMFDDLDQAGLGLVPTLMWNITQFPSKGRNTVSTFLRDPESQSRRLLARFIRDFIQRYRKRPTIKLYELTNELNLVADLDVRTKCTRPHPAPCVWDNFTTADMIEFSRDMVSLIKGLDPSRPITSGYAMPRPAAQHLSRRPEFGPDGPDWTPDTPEQFKANLLAVNEPFDLISVHIYPEDHIIRFGRPGEHEQEMIANVASIAKAAGKPLFVGEFGDLRGKTKFMLHALDEFVRNQVAYAAVWVWEFYQTSTYETYNSEPTRFNVEPGYSDDLIKAFSKTENELGMEASAPPISEPRDVLTWPLPCATITQPIDLAAVASDGQRAVARVEFRVDDQTIATVRAPPYHASFDPSAFGDRTVEIEVRAVATSGATATFKSWVKLNNSKVACDFAAP